MMIRPFNVNEYYSWLLSQRSPHNFIVVAKVDGNIDSERLNNAVKIAVKNQPNFNYALSLNLYGFKKNNGLLKIREIATAESWQKIAENELGTPFAENETLTRITLLKNTLSQYIVICFHHIIGDGASGIQFLIQLLDVYSQEKLYKKTVCAQDDEIILPIPQSRIMNENISEKISKTKIKSVYVNCSSLNRIRDFSRVNQISLNSCLSAIILRCASQVFNTKEYDVFIPVDLRRINKKNDANSFYPLAFLTSWIDFSWKQSEFSDELTAAKMIQATISNSIFEKQPMSNLLKMNELINQRTSNLNFLNTVVSTTPKICISNVGSIKTFATKKLSPKLTELHLSVNCEQYYADSSSFTVVISELHDCGLFLNINYVDTLISEREINIFISQLNNKFCCDNIF